MIYGFSQNKHLLRHVCYQVRIFLFVRKILEHFLAIKQRFGDLGGSIHKQHEHQQQHSTAQNSSTAQLSPPSSQHSTQLQKAARCMLNPEQARSSIIAQQCWRRWAASCTGDRAPCPYDDRAHQYAQADIDIHTQNKTTATTTTTTKGNDTRHTAAEQ